MRVCLCACGWFCASELFCLQLRCSSSTDVDHGHTRNMNADVVLSLCCLLCSMLWNAMKGNDKGIIVHMSLLYLAHNEFPKPVRNVDMRALVIYLTAADEHKHMNCSVQDTIMQRGQSHAIMNGIASAACS